MRRRRPDQAEGSSSPADLLTDERAAGILGTIQWVLILAVVGGIAALALAAWSLYQGFLADGSCTGTFVQCMAQKAAKESVGWVWAGITGGITGLFRGGIGIGASLSGTSEDDYEKPSWWPSWLPW